jgi:hypothetical protein
VESSKALLVVALGSQAKKDIALSKSIRKIRPAIALMLSALLIMGLSACSSNGYGIDLQPKTSSFLAKSFKSGEYMAPYLTPTADVGSTMEAMIQLSGVGYDSEKQSKAIDWLASNTDLINTNGLRGEYIFTAHALGFESEPSVAKALTDLNAAVDANGEITDTNNFSYAWVILGLAAAGEESKANLAAMNLVNKIQPNGGYKYSNGSTTDTPTADVTAFAIIALKATEGFGTSQDEAGKTFTISRAKKWLMDFTAQGNHWLGYGDVDVSGTAYGIMALHAIGVDATEYTKWLQGRINPKDSGIVSPWSDPDSDLFSTLQSILPLSNLSFIDVLNHIKN